MVLVKNSPVYALLLCLSTYNNRRMLQDSFAFSPFALKYFRSPLYVNILDEIYNLMVRASNCQSNCCNGTVFDPSIRRHREI